MIDPAQSSPGLDGVNAYQPQAQKVNTIPVPTTPTVEKVEEAASSKMSTAKFFEKPVFNSPLLTEDQMEINSTDILNLYRDHSNIERSVLKESSDIRQEDTKGFGDVKYAIATGHDFINREILKSAHDTSDKVDEAADKIQQRASDFYIASQARDFDSARDLSALKAQNDLASQKLATDILLAGERAAAAAALEASRTASNLALGHSQLSKEIAESKYEISRQVAAEGDATRALINNLKTDELNRMLIERNTDLQNCRSDYWGARDGLLNSQFAALSSQVNSQFNALNSQVAETRQGMVNFGTMAGVGQSSTSNAVR